MSTYAAILVLSDFGYLNNAAMNIGVNIFFRISFFVCLFWMYEVCLEGIHPSNMKNRDIY